MPGVGDGALRDVAGLRSQGPGPQVGIAPGDYQSPGMATGAGTTTGMLPGPPQFLLFDRQFNAQYPNVPPALKGVAESLVQHLTALYGTPGKAGQWEPMAHNYDYPQFLHDIAVVAAARGLAGVSEQPTGEQKSAADKLRADAGIRPASPNYTTEDQIPQTPAPASSSGNRRQQ
jgi:hypothetical protein